MTMPRLVLRPKAQPPPDSWWTDPRLPRVGFTAFVIATQLDRMSASKEGKTAIGVLLADDLERRRAS